MGIRRDPRMLNAQGEPAFIIDYRDEFGRRKQERSDACTMKDAQRVERALLTEIDKAKALKVSRTALSGTTFAAFVETRYLPTIKGQIEPSTYERYLDVYQHLKGYFGGMVLGSITPEAIDAYFLRAEKETTRRGTPPGAGELKNRRARLNAILGMALKDRVITFNPVDAAQPRKYTPSKRHIITSEEERRLLADSPEWLRPFIVIGLNGGMREAEIAAIKRQNIKADFIYIPAEESKTHTERYVPLNAAIRAALEPLTPVIDAGRPVSHLFWNPAYRSHYSAKSVSEAFSRLARKLEIPATFHCTRWTFVTRARDAGMPDARVMAITGHKTAAMLQHYTNVGPAMLKGATEVLCRENAEPVQNSVAQG